MSVIRMKTKDIAPVRTLLAKKQGNKCVLCDVKMIGAKKPALDHCHTGGHIRDVLCVNCNGIEGKIFNLARRSGIKPEDWLARLLDYYRRHATSQHGLVHPTYKTDEEKRIERNRKARVRRAAAKQSSS